MDDVSVGSSVKSERFGTGVVELVREASAIVRFSHGLEECLVNELNPNLSFDDALSRRQWDNPLPLINKIQAECIASTNARWGIFSRSRIALLPHQLWVCKQVTQRIPMRWMIADDVGLGKTIEAGLILWSLISTGHVKRLLVLCPAKLVGQWHRRMLSVFDIRLFPYVAEADTEKLDFWKTCNQVVASLQTLRLDREGRHCRLLDAERWDLVIVDEAHHLGADESGSTKGFRLIKTLEEQERIRSLLFFTGTPHKGKDFGFFSLLQLLRPDLFDPRKSPSQQLEYLPEAMIRNNKAAVTDLDGKRLFVPPSVESETYSFSEQETEFYALMTQFILDGKAYARGLGDANRRAVMLVLIAMQKLASSSFAAIRSALQKRLDSVAKSKRDFELLKKKMAEAESYGSMDEVSSLEEELVAASRKLLLIEDEQPRLRTLLDSVANIASESKIERIIELLTTQFAGRNVLLFTEYKATQSIVMSAIMREFGERSVTFINGDNEIAVELPSGNTHPLRVQREEAAESFNDGKVRFLVSTEAAGEGIDLQDNCFTLIHVDLPWNPMRLHQRVGRLYRYGQRKSVEVLNLRNEKTVESLIWDKLQIKLQQVNTAFRQVMDEPEDMFQLVLGMTEPQFFQSLFVDGANLPRESISDWFDAQTQSFGGEQALSVVKDIVGNASKFDYGSNRDFLPRVDLEDLLPFFNLALQLNSRRPKSTEDGISFKTPAAWRKGRIKSEYEQLHFDRFKPGKHAGANLLGMGHKLFEQAIGQALDRNETTTVVAANVLTKSIVVFRLFDQVTEVQGHCPKRIVGVEIDHSMQPHMLHDWELLVRLNAVNYRSTELRQSLDPVPNAKQLVKVAEERLQQALPEIDHGFKAPAFKPISLLATCDGKVV